METKLKMAYAVKNNLQVTVKSKFIRMTPFSLILKDMMQHKHLGLEGCFYLVCHRDMLLSPLFLQV